MRADETTPRSESLYAIKCLFSHPGRVREGERYLYEERITLWRAGSFEEAFSLAEVEAEVYARDNDCLFIRGTMSYHLFEESVGHGSEVWSVMRGSGMDPEMYAQTFCATPRDCAGSVD